MRALAALLLLASCTTAPADIGSSYLVATEPGWCRPCIAARPSIAGLEPRRVLERSEYRAHRIRSLPEVVVLDAAGAEIERWRGASEVWRGAARQQRAQHL